MPHGAAFRLCARQRAAVGARPPHALKRGRAAQTEELRRRLAAAELAREAESARAEAAEAAAGKEREVAPHALAYARACT